MHHDREVAAELERRLDILEQPDYDDPARRDLSGAEFAVLAALTVAVSLLAWLWGG